MSSRKNGNSGVPNGGQNSQKRPLGDQRSAVPAKKSKGNNGADSSKAGRDAGPGSKPPRWAKIQEVREIASQPHDAALKDGELDVQAFVNSRSFEIRALDESMMRTRTSQSSRAFQQVPFTLRRRAGAHNFKRVPKRLQRRAKREMKDDNTPLVSSRTRKPGSSRARLRAETALRLGKLAERKRRQKLAKGKGLDRETVETRMARPKIKRNVLNEPTLLFRKFRKRQQDKIWLPTHLWHAKRARMTMPSQPLWRFVIPLTPSQKVYRATHRAMWEKGSVAWDVSYMSTIGLSGSPRNVENVLRALGLVADGLWNERGAKWRAGAVHWSGSLSRRAATRVKIIGPANIIWNSQVPQDSDALCNPSKAQLKRLFIRIHPAAFLETFEELQRLIKGQNPRPYIEDLRYEIGSIEITGPASTEALVGVLHPFHTKPESAEPHASKFQALSVLGDAASLPAGTLLAFSVLDPRLRYPPRGAEGRGPAAQAAQQRLWDTMMTWSADLPTKPHDLFDRDVRFNASRLPSQQALNRRRAKDKPGVFLEATASDHPIPIIILASRVVSGPGTWTVMLPWKCVLPVWYSLMHWPLSSGGNPSLGGLQEQQQLALERGVPWFPGDFCGTYSGNLWELEQRSQRKKAWDRMPRGKRVNFETLDLGAGRKGEVGTGWSCDYETLLGLAGSDVDSSAASTNASAEGAMGAKVTETAAKAEKPAKLCDLPLAATNLLPKAQFNKFLAPDAPSPPENALVLVKVTMLGRGVAKPCARIYRLPTPPPPSTTTVSAHAEVPATEPPNYTSKLPSDLAAQWLARLPARKTALAHDKPIKHARPAVVPRDVDLQARTRLLAQELLLPSAGAPHPPPSGTQETINGHPLCPDAGDLIGFVTSGALNLRAGRGGAIGSLSVAKALPEVRRQYIKSKKLFGDVPVRLVVVRNAGENVGWLGTWELA